MTKIIKEVSYVLAVKLISVMSVKIIHKNWLIYSVNYDLIYFESLV